MKKFVSVYQVENLNKVDTTLYTDGDIFITKKTAGMLLNGKIKPLFNMRKTKKGESDA